MKIKKNVKIFFLILISVALLSFIFFQFKKDNEKIEIKPKSTEELVNNSNIIENVNYKTRDGKGNEYVINAIKGEIDYSNSNIIYLTKVNALIKLSNSEIITITSDYGKYNSENFDTIFSKNVIINYLENEIVGEYLDFSILRNTMIITKNVKYSNSKNTLFADVIEMDIKTKDTKIYMHEGLKKVNIKSKE
jgi:hypothetical protein